MAVPVATICPNVGFTATISPYIVCARPRMLAWLSRLNASILRKIDRPGLDAALEEESHVLCRSAAKRRLRNHFAVDHRPVVVRAVAVVVDAGGGASQDLSRVL